MRACGIENAVNWLPHLPSFSIQSMATTRRRLWGGAMRRRKFHFRPTALRFCYHRFCSPDAPRMNQWSEIGSIDYIDNTPLLPAFAAAQIAIIRLILLKIDYSSLFLLVPIPGSRGKYCDIPIGKLDFGAAATDRFVCRCLVCVLE